MTQLKEKIIEILHEHTRKIITEGENKPLIRRAIKNQTADQLKELFKKLLAQERKKLAGKIEKIIEKEAEFYTNQKGEEVTAMELIKLRRGKKRMK